MKRLKKGISLLLCVFLLCAMMPLTTLSAGAKVVSGTCGAQGNNLTWTIDTSTGIMTISGTGDMADYGDFDSVGPDPEWRSHWTEISQVHTLIVEEGVTSIGKYAFQWYNNIVNVYLPDSLERINKDAFESDDEDTR